MNDKETTRVVISAVDDIFFTSKIELAAKRAGTQLIQALNARQLSEKLEAVRPDLIILDLDSRNCAPLDSIRRIKGDERYATIPLLGFLSHVHEDLLHSAVEAGCEHVLPRSSFTAKLDSILRLELDRL